MTAPAPAPRDPQDQAEAPAHRHDPLADARLYARVMQWGTGAGVAVLLAGFTAYLTGWLPAHVPLERLPAVWGLPVAEYLRQTATPTGWGWLRLAGRGDMASLIGIGLLGASSLPPLLALAWRCLRRGDTVYAGICLAIALVLAIAASGLIGAGH